MKKKVLLILTALVSVLALSISAFVTSPYTIEGGAFLDKDTSSSVTADEETLNNAVYPQEVDGYYWRDPVNQNRLADYTENAFTGTVMNTYSSGSVSIWVYNARGMSNVIAIVSGDKYCIVGTGNSDAAAAAAKNAFSNTIPDFASLTLSDIFIPDNDPKSMYGGTVWTQGDTGIPVYVHTNWLTAQQLKLLVNTADNTRTFKMEGFDLVWGPDEFLGSGTNYKSEDNSADSAIKPNSIISATSATTLIMNGCPISLVPMGNEFAGYFIYLPQQKQLIVGQPYGNYLPNMAPLNRSGFSLYSIIKSMSTMIALRANNLMYLSGLPVIGAEKVNEVLSGQRDALQYIHNEVLREMNAGEDIDTIAATLVLPDNLRTMEWNQPYASSVEAIVKSVGAYYFGGFNGEVTGLTALSSNQRALFMIDMLGSESKALAKTREYQTMNDKEHIQMALEISSALMKLNPTMESRDLYVISLNKLAYMQTSAQVRNYYLTEVKAAEALTVNPSDTTAPTPVTAVEASDISATGLILNWTASTDNIGVIGYEVYYGSKLLGTTAGETGFDVTDLTEYTPYSFMIKAIDAAGNISEDGFVLTVKTSDVTVPSDVTGLGASKVRTTSLTLGWTASADNVGVTGYDIYNGTTLIGSTTGIAGFDVTGLTEYTEYSFTVRAKDAAGNISLGGEVLTIKTTDGSAPVITLNGNETVTIVLGGEYTDAGATAIDTFDGEISVITDLSGVNRFVEGTYIVKYTATDKAGNTSVATRTVIVGDKAAPVITLKGDNPVKVPLKSKYSDAGAEAVDEVDGTVKVFINDSQVNIYKPGTYTVVFIAKDKSGNYATANRTVEVVDVTAPVIILKGLKFYTVKLGHKYSDKGAYAIDNVDGAVSVTADTDSVDTNTVGTYIITYTAIDKAGNIATEVRTVYVVSR